MKPSGAGKFKMAYNKKHGITPETIKKELKPLVDPTPHFHPKIDFSKEAEKIGPIRLHGNYSG